MFVTEPLLLLLPDPVLPELLPLDGVFGELGVITLFVLVLEEEPLLLPVEDEVFPVAPVAELSEVVLVLLELVEVPVAAPWL